MEIKNYRLVPEGDGFTLVLYVNKTDTEFSGELGAIVKARQNIRREIKQFIKSNFKNVKVNTVKIVAGTMLVSSFSVGGITAMAAESTQIGTTQTADATPYSTYIVQSDDTLERIAALFATNVEDIMLLNNLNEEQVYAGQQLTLPVITYTVSSGDSLFTIAKEFNSTVESIKEANELESDTIYPGQQLVVPFLNLTNTTDVEASIALTEPPQEKESSPAAASTPPKQEKAETVTVAKAAPQTSKLVEGYVSTNTLAVRTGPGDTFKQSGTLKQGDAIRVLQRAGDWAYVQNPYGKGYINMNFVQKEKPNETQPGDTAPELVTAPNPISKGQKAKGYVYSDSLPVRTGPGDSFKQSGTLEEGDTVTVIQWSGNWAYVQNPYGKGYVDMGYIQKGEPPIDAVEPTPEPVPEPEPSPEPAPSPVVENPDGYVFTDSLIIRTGPGSTFKQSGTLGKGEPIRVIQHSGDWAYVQNPYGKGYINMNYVQKEKPGETAPELALAPNPIPKGQKMNGYVYSDSLPVRTGPGDSFKQSGTLENEDEVTVIQWSGDWAYVQNPYGKGYINMAYIQQGEPPADIVEPAPQPDPEPAPEPIPEPAPSPIVENPNGFVLAETLAVRSGPADTFKQSGTLKKGDAIRVIQWSGDWAYVQNPYGKGYINMNYVESTTTVSPISSIELDGKVVNSNVKNYRITGTAAGNGNIIHIIISDGENNIEKTALVVDGTFEIPFDISTLKDGRLTVRITQEDQAENKSEEVVKTIQKDTVIEAPTITTSQVVKKESGSYDYTITGQGEPNSTIYLSAMGQTGSTVINQTIKTGADGRFSATIDIAPVVKNGPFITVKQVDENGNESRPDMVGVLSYKVGSGDTLWGIATQFNTTVNEIMALNGLSSSTVYVGQQLKLPAVSSVTAPVFAENEFFNMGYVYFGSSQTYFDSIQQTQGTINVVSPSYFDLNADGSLKLTPTVDRYFIAAMQSSGIRVVPFLSNHWDRAVGEAALQNREQLSTEIADMIRLYNLDGVNVDIENVTHEYRDEYTDLVRLLREKLPEGKEVSVAVAANPNGWNTGWHGSYDYRELAKYSDYLMIMAYDESYSGSDPGPIASIDWVDRSIQYALNNGVSKEQIVLGVGHYGRYWKEGASHGGDGISNTQIQHALETYDGTVTYDTKTQSAKGVFAIEKGDPVMKVGGKELTPGTYTIWFENSAAIKAKINLIHKYDIKGMGNWSLGQENPQLWNDFATWLNPETKQQT